MKKLQSVFGAALVTLASIVVGVTSTANAAQFSSGNGMRVSPVRNDLIMKPGQSQTISVYVQNITNGDEHLKIVTNDFIARDETGTPSLLLDGETNPNHGLKQYLSTPSSIVIPKGVQKEIPVTIKIPADAAGGGYYGAVRFLPANAAAGGSGDNVSLAGSVASLILVKVPGDIKEDLQIASMYATKGENPSSFFISGNDISAVVRFQNKGNVQEQPFGKIALKKGGKTISTYELNKVIPPGNVIPDSIRKFKVDLNDKVGSFGKYTIEGNFGYGESGQLLTASTTFFVIPLYLIIGVLVLIAAIVGLVLYLKNYKKRILRNARR